MKHFIIFTFLFSTFIFAKESSRVLSEIRQLRNMRNTHISEELKQQKLNQNLISALKITIKRRYPNYNDKLKDLKIENVDYEQYKRDSFIYYVKYKELYTSYTFVNNPKLFLQYPIREVVYEKPDWFSFDQVGVNSSNNSNIEAVNKEETEDTANNEEAEQQTEETPAAE